MRFYWDFICRLAVLWRALFTVLLFVSMIEGKGPSKWGEMSLYSLAIFLTKSISLYFLFIDLLGFDFYRTKAEFLPWFKSLNFCIYVSSTVLYTDAFLNSSLSLLPLSLELLLSNYNGWYCSIRANAFFFWYFTLTPFIPFSLSCFYTTAFCYLDCLLWEMAVEDF